MGRLNDKTQGEEHDGCGRDRRRRWAGRPGRHLRAGRCRPQGDPARPGGRAVAGRPGVLVVRRADVRRQPRAAPPAHPRLARPGAAGLDGLGRLRSRGGSLAEALGRGLCGVRGRREAGVAEGPRRALVPDRGLGRARRLHGDRARQLGAALPHHVGHRPRRHRAVRASRARGCRQRARDAALSPSCQRADQQRRRGRWRARRGAGADLGGARRAELARRSRRVRPQGAGGDRHLRRHRRQHRAGAAELARAAGRAARAHAVRRARLCRRAHAGHHGSGGRQRHQPRPHVALHRGHRQLEPDLEPARHPHPAGPVIDLARRARTAPAGAAVSGLRYARHARAHHADAATTTPGSFSARRSSSASSRCRARSRTRT